MLYDCGVLLNEEGQFGRPDYRDHNSPLSLHSFYLIEWATFGVLCMALLTDEKAKERIHGGCCSCAGLISLAVPVNSSLWVTVHYNELVAAC